MLSLDLTAVRRVLCIGAHGDDVEIGCGATLALLADRPDPPTVDWLIMTGDETRHAEVRRGAGLLCGASLGTVHTWDGRDGHLPYDPQRTKDAFRALTADLSPDLVFTHRLEDRHQDHKFLAELSWQTFRDHLVLEYEIPKYEGDLAPMDCFVPVTAAAADRKISVLMDVYGSQRSKYWFSDALFRSLMHLRGIEARAQSGLAEAFTARKISLSATSTET